LLLPEVSSDNLILTSQNERVTQYLSSQPY
jgi:hypothetical protein